VLTLAASLAAILASGLSAQALWSGGPVVQLAMPTGTMADYFGNGTGFGLTLSRPTGPVMLRIDAVWTRFGERTVTRQLNGAGPPIGITSSGNFLTALAGPEGELRLGGWRGGLAAQGGLGYVQSTGSTILPGDPAQVQRSNTYSTFTWAVSAGASLAHRVGSGRLSLAYSVVQIGKSDFLREYNLPIGVISGIYLNPTPYPPLYTTASLALTFPL